MNKFGVGLLGSFLGMMFFDLHQSPPFVCESVPNTMHFYVDFRVFGVTVVNGFMSENLLFQKAKKTSKTHAFSHHRTLVKLTHIRHLEKNTFFACFGHHTFVFNVTNDIVPFLGVYSMSFFLDTFETWVQPTFQRCFWGFLSTSFFREVHRVTNHNTTSNDTI